MIRGVYYGACKKLAYRDKVLAQLALAEAQARPSGRRLESRDYHCRRCKMFHLTHQEKRGTA